LSIVAEELRSRQIKRPLVLTVHGYFVRELVSAESLDPSLPMVEELLRQELSTYELATRLICVDTRIRDYIHDNAGIDKERMAIIPNAVNTVEFHPIDDGSMLALRDALGIPRGSRVLLCPRRLVPKNGVEYAVKAMRTISRTVDDALLIIAGDGPLRDHLQGLIRNEGLEGHVRLIGGVAHGSMPAYYQCADIVVIPSVPSQGVEEATSLSMLEGMACAKPVMVTDIGGLKETVVDGSNGYMVSAGDPEGIAHAAVRIFDDKEGSEAVARTPCSMFGESILTPCMQGRSSTSTGWPWTQNMTAIKCTMNRTAPPHSACWSMDSSTF
jgi:glycosyltransferase involved in cell wall biosynthesis